MKPMMPWTDLTSEPLPHLSHQQADILCSLKVKREVCFEHSTKPKSGVTPKLFGFSSKLSFVFDPINFKRSWETWICSRRDIALIAACYLFSFDFQNNSIMNATPQNWKANDSHILPWYYSKFVGNRSAHPHWVPRGKPSYWRMSRPGTHEISSHTWAHEIHRPKKENIHVEYTSLKHITIHNKYHTLHILPQLYISRFSMWDCKHVNPWIGSHTQAQNINFRPGRPSCAFDATGRVTLVRRRFAVVQKLQTMHAQVRKYCGFIWSCSCTIRFSYIMSIHE